MTKCKRMLVAILILSMLSSNVAYAAGSNMGVAGIPTETATTETITEELVEAFENVAETTEVSGEDTISSNDASFEEMQTVEDVEDESILGTETVGETELTTEVGTVIETEAITEVETITETEVVTEPQTEEVTTEAEEMTTEMAGMLGVQASATNATILGWLEEMVPESYTLYSDGYSAITVLECPDADVSQYDLVFTMKEAGKSNLLDFPEMDIVHSDYSKYYIGTKCFYAIAKGKENGSTSVVITMSYDGASASVTVPVTITTMPEDYIKLNDPGLYDACISRSCSTDWLLDETEMDKVSNLTNFTINTSSYPAYLPSTDLSEYLGACTNLTIQGNAYVSKHWQMNYDMIKKLPIKELKVYQEPGLTSIDLGEYPSLESVEITGTKNLETITFSKSCEKLSYFEVESADKLTAITASEDVELSKLESAYFTICKALSDVSVFANTPNVKTVQLQSCSALSDVSALKNCKKLTATNAIWLNNTAVSAADIIDLMYVKDMDVYVGATQYFSSNVYTNNGVWHIESDSELISTEKNVYYSSKSIKAINPGVAKVKVYAVSDPEIYKEFYVYVKHYDGVTGQLGEVISEDLLPELGSDPWGHCVAVWDKVSKKIVDMLDKKTLVENVTDYAGCWVYGIEEADITSPYDTYNSAPYYYAGISVSENGVSSYIREYDSDADAGSNWQTKITSEVTAHDDLNATAIKQIGSGCILTEEGVLYCINSDNTLSKVDTGVTEFLDYGGTKYGIIYVKNKNLYNSMSGTTKIRTDINNLIQGSLYVTSTSKTYKVDPTSDAGYYEVQYPSSTTDSTYVSKPLKQFVRWGSMVSGRYHLLEDGTLYNEYKGILDTDVVSIDELGYFKNVDGKDVRYTFTGEVVEEFYPDGTYDSKYMSFNYMLGKEGLYRQSTSFVLSDVAAVRGADGITNYALRTDGSIWQLPPLTSTDLPKKIYPIETESDEPVEEATAIAFANEAIVLETKDAQQVSVNCIPEGSSAGRITYSIDDHCIATVTSSGMLRAVKNGETTLYAESENGLTASCTVKVVLPVEMTGIALAQEEQELTLVQGASKKLTVLYTPEDTTEDRTIIWTSSDTEKVSVDADGTLHALTGTMGEPVTITGVSVAHDNLKVSCKVSVNKILTEEEIDIPQGITVTNNVTKTLADIALPKGWSFLEPATELSECGEKSFPAVYTEEYCEPVERNILVQINHITGVNISGNNIFEVTQSEIYTAELQIEGAGKLQDCYNVDWKIKDTGIACIDGSSKDMKVTVLGKKKGSTELTIKVTLKDASGEVCETLTAKRELNIKPTGVIENVKILLGADALSHGLVIDEADQTVHIPYNQKSDMDSNITFSKKYKFKVDAQCYKKGELVETTAVKWSSSDQDVATVKTKNGVTTITLTGDGVTVLTATAKDEGKSKAELILSVEDYTPRLEDNTLTLNKALEDGSIFYLYPAYEKAFAESITVYEKIDGALTESSVFEVEKDEDKAYGWRLKLKDDVRYESVKNKTYSKLYLRTVVGDEGIYDIPVKIKVIAKLPTVTIKQTDKVNLFYTDDLGKYSISVADASISSVEYISKTTDETLPQLNGEWKEEEGILVLSQQNVTKENYKSIVNKGTIRIVFEGYRAEAYANKTAYEKAVTVGKEYKQPQWVLTTAKLTRYAALSEQIKVGVYDKADKTKKLIPIAEEEITLDTAKLKNTYSVAQILDNELYITAIGNRVSETLPILITKDNFRDAKKLNLKLTIKEESVLPTYRVSAKAVTLNRNYAGKEQAALTIKAGTESDQKITDVRVYLNNELYQNQDVAFTYLEESGLLTLRLQTIGAAEKYNFQIAPVMSTDEGRELELARTKLKVTVSDKTPVLKLSIKGTINPIDRVNTSVQITPKITNLLGGVTSVAITNEYNTLFEADVENGKIVIRAKESSQETKLINKQKYKLNLTLTTESGHVFENVMVTITPKQGKVKIKPSVNKIICFKPVKGVKYHVPLGFNVISPAGAQIESIKLINNADNFVYDAANKILYLENADCLAVKNHKLTFAVNCKGSCENTKATEVTVTISLKK